MSFNMETAGIWSPHPYTLCWRHSSFTATERKSTPKEDLPPGQKWMDMIILYIWVHDREQPGSHAEWDKVKLIQMMGEEKRKPAYLLWPQDRSSISFLPCVFSDQHRQGTQLNQGTVLPGSVQDGECVHTGLLCFMDAGDAIQASVHTFPLNTILLLDVCM